MLLTAGMTALGHMTRGRCVGKVGVSRVLSRIPVCVSYGQTSPDRLKVRRCREDRRQPPDHGVSRPSGLPPAGGAEDDVGRPVAVHGAAGRRLRGLRDRMVSGDAQEVRDLGESGEGSTAAGFRPVWYKDRRRHVSVSVFVLDPMQTLKKKGTSHILRL